jgi:hypothetical protein
MAGFDPLMIIIRFLSEDRGTGLRTPGQFWAVPRQPGTKARALFGGSVCTTTQKRHTCGQAARPGGLGTIIAE